LFHFSIITKTWKSLCKKYFIIPFCVFKYQARSQEPRPECGMFWPLPLPISGKWQWASRAAAEAPAVGRKLKLNSNGKVSSRRPGLWHSAVGVGVGVRGGVLGLGHWPLARLSVYATF